MSINFLFQNYLTIEAISNCMSVFTKQNITKNVQISTYIRPSTFQILLIFFFSGRVAFISIQQNIDDNSVEYDPQKQNEILEVSALIIDWPTFLVVEIFHSLVKPIRKINSFLQKNVHGLSARNLDSQPPWFIIRQQLVRTLVHWNVSFVIGAGLHILTLIDNLPGQLTLGFSNLQLPCWRDRQYMTYTALHAVVWNHFSKSSETKCKDSQHNNFRPSQKYVMKYSHKVFYNFHCSLKDAIFMICAVWKGEKLSKLRDPLAGTLKPTISPLTDKTLEGISVLDSAFYKLATKTVKIFLAEYLETPSYRRQALTAPVLPPLFEASIPIETRQSAIERVFRRASRLLAKSTRCVANLPHLQLAALKLQEANFCEIRIENTVQRNILVASTINNRQVPKNATLHQISFQFPTALQQLKELRSNFKQSTTNRLIIENLIRTKQIGRIRKFCRKVRALFTLTPITLIIHDDYLMAKRTASIAKKYNIDVFQIRNFQNPDALSTELPCLFLSD